MSDAKLLSDADAQSDAPGWRVVDGELRLVLDCGSFTAAVALINQIAELAEERNHHPDIDLRYRRVRLALASHDAGGLTATDVELANAISRLADSQGYQPDPAGYDEDA